MLAIKNSVCAIKPAAARQPAAVLPLSAASIRSCRRAVIAHFKETPADYVPATTKGASAAAAGLAVETPRELVTPAAVGPFASNVYNTLSWVCLVGGVLAMSVPGWVASTLFQGGLIPFELKLLTIAAGATLIPVSQALRTLMVARELHLTETRTAQQLCYMGTTWGFMSAYIIWDAMPYLDSIPLRLLAAIGIATGILCVSTMHRVTESAEAAATLVAGPQVTGIVRSITNIFRTLTQCCLSVFSPVNGPSLWYSFMSLFFTLGGLAFVTHQGRAMVLGHGAEAWLGLTRDTAATIATRLLTTGLYAAGTLALALKEIADRGLERQPMPSGMNSAIGIMSTVIAIAGIAGWQMDIGPITDFGGVCLLAFLVLGLYSLYQWSAAPAGGIMYPATASLPHTPTGYGTSRP